MRNIAILSLASALLTSGCSLNTGVQVAPLTIQPANIERATTIKRMVDIGDYARARYVTTAIEARNGYDELHNLGKCEMASRRLASARRHLRASLDREPPRTGYAEIAWTLSQLEYLDNNFAAAEDWARTARDRGMRVKDWHIEYLASLGNIAVHQVEADGPVRVPMLFGRPEIPRIASRINGTTHATAVIDSGAVLSIVSASLAERIGVRSLGTFEGEFFGLMGESIPVRFGLIDSLQIGTLIVRNVPVAIMADRSLQFFVRNREPFKMDLLLGANFLREFRLEFDFRRDVMTFSFLSPAERTPADDQNLFFNNFRPVVQTLVNGRGWYLFLLDTGSEVTFLSNDSMFGPGWQRFAGVHSATLQGLGGAQKRGAKVEDVQIGVDKWAGRFVDIPLYENLSQDADGIIGQNFMKHFVVTIDFGSMRMDLRR